MVIEHWPKAPSGSGYLDGSFLVAMPAMPDDRFARTVIYLCAHSAEGAMGIVVNKRAEHIAFAELLVQLDVINADQLIRLPEAARQVAVLSGGPVETGRGFVLHSPDYFIENATLPIAEDVALTITVDILRAIARGRGPRTAFLALGYAMWGPGQLESEIQANAWLNCPADLSILFDDALETKYARSMKKIGITPAMLSAEAGHA